MRLVLLWLVFVGIAHCQISEEDDTVIDRKKRTLDARSWKRWPDATIPFCYDDNLPDRRKTMYVALRAAFSRHSCIRSQFYANCSDISGGGARLMPGGQPYSYIGRQWSVRDVTLTGAWYLMAHEWFHLVGGQHEQNNGQSLGMATMIQDNVSWWYKKAFVFVWSEKDRADKRVLTKYFDTAAPTFYSVYGTSTSGFPVYDWMYQDLYIQDRESVFLDELSRDLNDYYDCWGLRECGTKPTCYNEGYPGVYNNQCQCVCPRGLDPAANCNEVKKKPTGASSWPDTDLMVFKVRDSCPTGLVESTIVFGGIADYSELYMRAGKASTVPWVLDNDKQTLAISVCHKANAGNTEKWPPGEMTFFTTSECPDGLLSGSFSKLASDGTVLTDIKMCSDRAIYSEPILGLPQNENFALLAYREKFCQEIDVDGFRRRLVFKSVVGSILLSGPSCSLGYFPFQPVVHNWFIKSRGYTVQRGVIALVLHGEMNMTGDVPDVDEDNWDSEKTYDMSFCTYEPTSYDCGAVISLTAENPTVVITSPNYPGQYPENTECNWVINVEEGARIRAEFTSFEISEFDEFSYRRYILNSIPTKLTTGSRPMLPQNIVSIYNLLAFNLKTRNADIRLTDDNWFNLTVTRLGAEDYCYSLADKGESYDGDWSYSIDGYKCLPWNERFDHNVTYSGYADFEGSTSTFLTGSACRNPGGKLHKPACLTTVKGGNYTLRYCDVCHIEYGIKDQLFDCAAAVDGNPAICTAATGARCLSTCISKGLLPAANIPPKVGDVTCPNPSIPANTNQVCETVKSVYHVGDKIRMYCMGSNKTANFTCLTSGQWSEWKEFCTGCDPGWAEHEGKCYKMVGRDETWYGAKDYCKVLFGAYLLSPKTESAHTFFINWRDSLGIPTQQWWIGGFYTDGEWRWDVDGSLMNMSRFGWQQDSSHSKLCTVHTKWSKWISHHCSAKSAKLNFICEKPVVGSPISCVDRNSDCAAMLEENPRACSDRVIRTNTCPYTCGADICDLSGSTCSNFAVIENSEMVVSKTELKPGETVEYRCNAGYEHMGGSLVRACKRDGQLTGTPPVCSTSAITQVGEHFPLKMYRRLTIFHRSYSGDSLQFNITRSGKVYQWQVYCACAYTVTMQVWRHQSGSTYKLIGQNDVQCYKDLAIVKDVDVADRITVEEGDRIGLYHRYGSCFTYYPCSNSRMPLFSGIQINARSYRDGAYTVSENSDFEGNSCLMFAFNAKIGP